MNNSRPKYSFRGIEGNCNSDAFADYINSKLNHWKMDIWQLGTDDITSEWNSLRPRLLDCKCRSRMVKSERELVFEFRYWYFVHALWCLKEDIQKMEEFVETLLKVIEKEGQAFWNQKEAAWARIEQKAQEVNYEIKDNDFLIQKDSIMNCHNEGDLDEEEQTQITYLSKFQNQKPSPQQTQQERQAAQARETKRQQKQAEQKQKEAELLEKVTKESQKNNASVSSNSNSNSEENQSKKK